jgi:hypothetical protein
MRRGKLCAIAVLVLLALPLFICLTPTLASAVAARSVPVGAVLYLWYGYNYVNGKWTGGLGSSHWNDSSVGIVKDRPGMGFCASLDNATLAWQLASMRDAGCSWILVSWWGYGGTGSGTLQTLDSAINNATLNLFRYL